MAAVVPIPVSQILKSKAAESGGEEPLKKSREEWRKAKELEEARKAGTAPAAVDEEGRDINPHIPQYISAAPWYYNTRGPTLKHQRQPGEDNKDQYATVGEWYNRGVDTSTIATRYRKGACENCGAMTHQKKECMERPRRIGAKFTGAEIAPDEFVQPDFKLDFDGKRDRWNGYDAQEYTAIIEDFKKVEDAKRQLKTDKIMSGNADGDKEEEEEDDDEEDEDKYVDEVDMPGTKVDSKQRITVRNLRIREDTAKYLRNLDPTSAYYDPKTRSMRDNPYKNTGKNPDEVGYAGENFVRFSGDTAKQATAQLFAWEAGSAGFEVNLIAEPTKLEKLQVEYSKKREEIKHHVQESLLERYGGREHLEAPPKALLLAQTEDYVEYSRTGKIIKGGEKVVVRSRYEEDVFINNHISVWGSWWREGQWGFKCCHSTVKNSYCTGEAGVVAHEPAKGQLALPAPSISVSAPASDTEVEHKRIVSRVESQSEEEKPKATHQVDKEKKRQKKKEKKRKQKKNRKRRHSTSSSSSSESDEEEDKTKKLKIALEKKAKEDAMAEKILEMGDRKRSYNSMKADVAVPTEEDMEAYYMKRKRDEDPMAAFL